MDPDAMLTRLKPIRRRRLITGRRICVAACITLAILAVMAARFGWLS